MSTKLEHFYIRAQSQNSSTGELELWANPSTQEILMETDDVDVIYAEDYDALRSALEARYPHPALVPKPRKLLPEVDKVDTLRTLDKAGRVLPSA